MVRLRLIYDFEFGDLSCAVEAADAYLRLAREGPRSRWAQALRLSTYPHRIVGNWDVVHPRLEESLAIAREQGHRSDEAQALHALAVTAVEHLQYGAASERCAELLNVIDRCPIVANPPMRLDIAYVAAMQGDMRMAAEQRSRAEGIILNIHGRCDLLGVRAFTMAMQGSSCSDADLAELLDLDRRLQGRPGQEIPTIAIALTLHHRGQSDQAIDAVSKYVRETRRERYASRNPIIIGFASGNPISDPAEIRRRAGCHLPRPVEGASQATVGAEKA